MIAGLVARPLRLVALLAALAAVAAGLWSWQRAGSSTEVSADAAVRDFRRDGGGDAAGPAPAGVPRPGVYTMRQEGSERGGAGPLSVTRDLPGTARYVVRAVPGGWSEELLLSEEHVEGVRLRVDARGAAREVARRTHVTFLGVGRDDRREPRPAPLRLPRPLTVGRAWESAYRAGTLRVTARSEVLRAETVEVDGRPLTARVVRTVSDTEGAHPGRRTDVVWWSPALTLPLRWEIDMRITGVVSLRTRAALVLESTTPLV
ncbi:hypothetical protein [Miltoncostaea marina]|uniref:hypothetical protein n=1 Tax=Miltoncostaea marina TaxID=2843215 RepID=UPI001C3CF8AE|nr:hypothetical protein [Miltoncostaea marina]